MSGPTLIIRHTTRPPMGGILSGYLDSATRERVYQEKENERARARAAEARMRMRRFLREADAREEGGPEAA